MYDQRKLSELIRVRTLFDAGATAIDAFGLATAT